MRSIKLWILAGMAMMAFGAVGAAAASAEDGPPEVLCFVKGCIGELEGKYAGGAAFLSDLAGNLISATSVQITVKGCKELTGSEGKDGNLCNNQTITFEGIEAKKAKCNTPGDAAGIALVKGDGHLAAELNAAKTELEPLLLARILNAKEAFGPIILECALGTVKIEVKGTIACLVSPGLTLIPTTKEGELSCKVNATTHDPETGECELLCEWLKEEPFQSKIGAAFEDAWMNGSGKGKTNKEVFIDD